VADIQNTWRGIPRYEIPWFPSVGPDTCIGCTLCYVTCGRGVYEMHDNKAAAASPYKCMVGCSTCGVICPVEAISFPGRDLIWKAEREHKTFTTVRQEAKDKMAKAEAARARAAAAETVSKLTTQVRMEIAGEFGEKRFLMRLGELIRDRSYDIVNLQLSVPTVKGALERPPSFMSFDVTSTEQQDIQEFLPVFRTLIGDNGLVLVSERKL
jgi:NAD-dependent dihydropyrimidine dehydrogenase PreA subunit